MEIAASGPDRTTDATERGTDERPRWLVLAVAGPALELAVERPHEIRLERSSPGFVAALGSDRPTLALLTRPPADREAITAALDARRRRPRLRIVLLEQPEAIAARVEALETGFDDALPSTMAREELAARLRLLAHPRPRRARDPIAIGAGLELDLVAHELRRDGTPIHLRPKEYRLLEVLARHPGRAFSRQQLLDRVWGPGRSGDPRTVDVHVRWLRSKIEDAPEAPTRLVTVRGMGYRLDPDR